MTQPHGTPGRRSPLTIAQASQQARAKLIPIARRYHVQVTSMLGWTGDAQRIVLTTLAPVAAKFGVKPLTLIKWASTASV